MSINDASTPAEFPNNEWTQMIEAIGSWNERARVGGVLPADGVPNVGTPMPAVRSADFGRPAAPAAVPPPLSAEEIEEYNRQALASGLVVGPVNPSMARTLDASGLTIDGEAVAYGSLEEAIAAGAPVGADPQAVAEGAMRFREVAPSSPVVPVRTPVGAAGRQTAREFIAPQPAMQLPRLPDFKKVQMIDMVNGMVYVDGLEFALEPAESKMLRKFCVTKAKEQIEKALTAALKDLAEGDDGGTEAV